MNLTFRTVDSTLEITDPIEHRQYTLTTERELTVTEADTRLFRFPVDAAVSFEAEWITLPSVEPLQVRDEHGDSVLNADHLTREELPRGRYIIELSAPIKLYLRVESPLSISAEFSQMILDFGESTDITVGARSYQQRPPGTVVTTERPEDMMEAISTFGGSLKTTSPERSFPTLRGHPPNVRLGDELSIPDGFEPPETGLRIELPRDYRSVFVAAPLAYYLGASVVPAPVPRIVSDSGLEYALDTHNGYEEEVARTLEQTFFLDCLTRTEGLYPVRLRERVRVEPILDLDLAELYDVPIDERVEAYLDVPYEHLAPYLPQWKQTTHVEPVPDSVELLPFVVNDLSIVRVQGVQPAYEATVQTAAVEEFLRGVDTVRGASAAAGSTSYVQPEPVDTLEHTWVGEGTPIRASKAMIHAFRNRFTKEPTTGDIDIAVVCNDRVMIEELDVATVYSNREELPFNVEVHRNLSTDELADVLASPKDFLHFIGHIESDGIRCHDGLLDASRLDEVDTTAFLLNACSSYHQGRHLIENGAVGGVVTLSDVINNGAIKVGYTFARLLNYGYSLRSAIDVAGEESIIGGQYTVVGDGGHAIAQAECGTPNLVEIERTTNGFDVAVRNYPTAQFGMGTLYVPYISEENTYYLNSGTTDPTSVSTEKLRLFLSLDSFPVKFEGELRWSDEIEL